MDRRPLGASLPANRPGHRLARAETVAAGAATPRRLTALAVVLALAAAGVALWLLVLSPSPSPQRLLVGVDDDTLKWTSDPLGVVAAQRRLGADAVRVWVPWSGETRPGQVRRDELARAELAATHTATFLGRLGAAYRASGRTRPLVDAFGHNPYPLSAREPAAARHRGGFIGEGDYPELVSALSAAFSGTPQRSLDVWYLEDGFQTAVPQRLVHRYTGSETAATVAPAAQAAQLRDAILLAACQPHVRAFFNFEFVDESRLAGWQSGLEWRGALRKPAAEAFLSAARTAARGAVHCRNGG